ncbi:MAG TPA: 16S rRNA (adenine(1518)-N(6)/adenine(1519)-N(6))-dimethyltransferase RsmA [Flavitalea sp.]|nr:16S rRNA (adenine(1518)-N(6)/adenine(1519)-N(6))-dimethyltransferase RsmA [Flavitalea sp.]HTF31797.1 16S rRNA (adenine(1518)-N(6)/adenine(1519)-N(6))-dimethyltransferase RsmA [Flavitalea sp.]
MYTLKKSLGQHFLTDENISKRIVDTLLEKPFQRLVEVGPGGAALTKYLLGIPDIEFKCVEIDDEKVAWLEKNYPALKGRIIHESFLETDQPFGGPFTVIGNFPYNISSQILFKVLEWRENVECVIGMFQKEVAERIASGPGSKVYGVISVLMQGFYHVEFLFEVNENSFNPPPKVKSAVIRLTPLNEPVKMKSERSFFVLVKTAFNQRRKTLRNAVKALFTPEVLEDEIFNKRAEQLSVADFGALTFKLK